MQLKTATRSIVVSALIGIVATSSVAQQKPVSAQQKPVSISIPAEQKWEYVVVSYGKTEFGSPQKTLAYRPIGLPGGQEAQDLQNNLDILGRFGWEAVAFVGAIGGDQQIVLKRKYDKSRIASEIEAISRGAALYIKDMADILEREQSLREAERLAEEEARNKPHLIELDVEAAKAARAKLLVELQNSYTEAFKTSELSGTSTIAVDFQGRFSTSLDVEIKTDLSKQFLMADGKSYRLSAVSQYLKDCITKYRFYDNLHPQDRYSEVTITAKGFIQFEGNPVEVATYTTTYSTILNNWR